MDVHRAAVAAALALLRHGGMGRVFSGAYAPSTLGSFLRAFTFGHVGQLDAVASRFLTRLADRTPLLSAAEDADDYVLVDVDDTIIEVHEYAKQGAGFGYTGVRGLNALLATVTTSTLAPVVVAQRLRKGSCGSPRDAKRLVTDALKTIRALSDARPLVRADSAFYGRGLVGAAVRTGGRLGHRPARSEGQGRHRRDPGRCVGDHRVHRRGLRRADSAVGLPSGGRRDRVHRVLGAEEGRPGTPPAGGPPDPRPQPPRGRPPCVGASDVVAPAARRRSILGHHLCRHQRRTPRLEISQRARAPASLQGAFSASSDGGS